MELDNLKKSWSALDKLLQKEKIVDEKQIEELIANYQSGVTKGLNRLTNLQKVSLSVGLAFSILLALTLVIDTEFFNVMRPSVKEVVMGVFIALSMFGGFLWDWRTYKFGRTIKVDEMSTVEIIGRVNKFREKVKRELVAACCWVLLFLGLYYWMRNYYELPVVSQIVFILGSLALIGGILFFFYKKLVYKYLNDIERNLSELKELETHNNA